jgi:hypothetical protein
MGSRCSPWPLLVTVMRSPGLALRRRAFLSRTEGFDAITLWVFEKR